MRALVTIYFWLVFVLTAPIVFAVGTLVFLVSAPFDPDRRVIHAYICRTTFAYLRINPGWRVTVEGRERLGSGPCVIVANHQSMADILACMGLFRPFKFVSKSSLFGVPLVGWMMSFARYVSVERGKPRSTHQMLEGCRKWLRRGMPVLIFPEGTYSGGKQLLPFKRGAFLLAIQEKVALVPVVLQGTQDVVFEDGPWLNPGAHVRVTVLPAIPAAELGADEVALSSRVRAQLESALGRAPVEAPESALGR